MVVSWPLLVRTDLFNISGKMGAGDWDRMLPEPDLVGRYFHEQFKILQDHQRLDLCVILIKKDKTLTPCTCACCRM
jgi:hypothetical protein